MIILVIKFLVHIPFDRVFPINEECRSDQDQLWKASIIQNKCTSFLIIILIQWDIYLAILSRCNKFRRCRNEGIEIWFCIRRWL
jgi:hypothetical protein